MLVLPKKTSHPLHTDSILEINRVTVSYTHLTLPTILRV